MEAVESLCEIDCSHEELPEEFAYSCQKRDFKKVKEAIDRNVNIYKIFYEFKTPLMMAIRKGNEKVVNLLLDVYERDLEPLRGSGYTRALVAMPEDLTEEFMKTVESEASGDDFVPVLLKKFETPKYVYLRKKLQNKSDPSLMFAMKLEAKNGFCDLNGETKFHPSGSVLHHAIHEQMMEVVERLLKMPTIDTSLINYFHDSPLQLAISRNNIKAVEEILRNDNTIFSDDSSFLSNAVRSGYVKMLELVVRKMVENGKFTLKEILTMEIKENNYKVGEHLFQFIAIENRFDFFLKLNYDKEFFYAVDSRGDSILHCLLRSSEVETKNKLKITRHLIEKYPKLVMIRNNCGSLALHETVTFYGDYELIEMVFEKTVEVSGNADIFCENMEIARKMLENCFTLYYQEHSKVESLMEKLMNGKLKDLLEIHGDHMLHYFIEKSPVLKGLSFLLTQKKVKFDLNRVHGGMNAYFRVFSSLTNLVFKQECAMSMFKMLTDYQEFNDINAADSSGKTGFMFLCEICDDNDMIRSMIIKSPDCVHRKTIDDSICFHFIHKNKINREIAEVLIENGADPQAMNNSGWKPIAQSVSSNNKAMFLTLFPLEPEKEVNRKYGERQQSMLHLAMSMSDANKNIVEKLMEKNVDLVAVDSEGNTPIHKMSSLTNQMVPYYDLCRTMLTKNVNIDINTKNNDGETPLSLTLSKSTSEISRLILEHFYDKIDFSVRNNKGETLTHKLASLYDFDVFLEFLEKYPKFLDHVDAKNTNGDTPIHYWVNKRGWQIKRLYETTARLLTLDCLRQNFQEFVNRIDGLKAIFDRFPSFFTEDNVIGLLKTSIKEAKNREAFEFLLTKIKCEDLMKVCDGKKNILHVICDKNEPDVIDLIINFLPKHQLEVLKNQIDDEGRKPVDLLNDHNQMMFMPFLYYSE